mmetsp:Transcript_41550/g.102226  ORF Transcript_41550/g.102226 Transcript_41550/m.102226 type:complete len:247 (+) Transcript_41550:107-847(+)
MSSDDPVAALDALTGGGDTSQLPASVGGGMAATADDDFDSIIDGLVTADPVKLDMPEQVHRTRPAGSKAYECDVCERALRGEYFALDGKPHCRTCYGEMFRCKKCKGPIADEYVKRDNKPYHPQCVPSRKCQKCRAPLSTGDALKALGGYWHPHCFKCADCGAEVEQFYVNKQKMPVCQKCHERRNPIAKCAACGKVIEGEYLTVKRKAYCKPCFKCSSCAASLAGGSYYDVDGKVMCQSCADKVS